MTKNRFMILWIIIKCNFIKIIIVVILPFFILPGCHKKNRPPYTPYTPSGPTTGRINTTYDFSSLATDPEGDSVVLRFSWKNGDTSDWSELVPTEGRVSMAYSWPIPDNYYVKAQAKDKNEHISEWSLPLIIKIVGNFPPVPSIPTGPLTGLVEIIYQFTSLATDPEEDSIAIRFDWGNGDTSDWSSLLVSGASDTIEHFWSGSGIYLIRAQAKDKKAAISGWTEPLQIIIISVPNHPPNTPSISGPSNGYISTTYTFFSLTTDPDGDYFAIRLDWGDGDTSNWSNLVPSGNLAAMSHSWLAPDTYYIKAQAMDMGGLISDWSLPHSIEIFPRLFRY